MITALVFALCIAPLPQEPPAAPQPVAVSVRGVVPDSKLMPAADVAIAVLDGDTSATAAALAAPLLRTGADGGFTIDLQVPRNASKWLVFGGGRFATSMHELSTYRASSTDLGAFALAPGTTAAGRVRDADGAPLAGVCVTGLDLLDSRPFLEGRDRGAAVVCRTVARTGADGIFRLPGMVLSAGRVQLRKDGFYDQLLQPVGAGDPLDVRLTRAPTFRGRVLDADGQPVVEATVGLGEQGGNNPP